MTDKKVSDYIPATEILAQLAEELSELIQAVLKLRRAMDGKNPTPKTIEECRASMEEELADVLLCLWVFLGEKRTDSFFLDLVAKMLWKYKRWITRLQEREEEKHGTETPD